MEIAGGIIVGLCLYNFDLCGRYGTRADDCKENGAYSRISGFINMRTIILDLREKWKLKETMIFNRLIRWKRRN